MLRIYKHYYRFLLRYRFFFALFVTTLVVSVAARSALPYFNKLFVDQILEGDFGLVWKLLFAYVGVRIVEEISTQLIYLFGDNVLLPAGRDARIKVLEKIQELDFAFHLSRSTGSLISAMKRGDGSFFSMFHSLNIQLVRVVLGFVIMLGLFLQVGVEIVLILALTFALNTVAMYFLLKHNWKVRTDFNDAEDDISGIIVDNLINFETVKLFAKERAEIKRLTVQFEDWLAKLWRFAISFRIMDTMVGTIGNIGLLAALMVGLMRLEAGLISVGDYVLIVSFMAVFYPQFFELMYQIRNIAKYHTDIEKYFQFLDMESTVKDPVDPVYLDEVAGQLTFDHVGFSYPDGKQGALQEFDLDIAAGESVALVGHSGAGKTTVTKLLLRFFDPTKGSIFLDGVDIRDLTKSHLRSFIGVVPQEPIMFNNTIAYNIAYGSDDVAHEDIVRATKMANLHDFIETLPDGYETNVGERGVKLSGGQKQRLAIARMVLSDPEIIIFDEATSQLDSESEQKIQEAFWRVAEDKTTIIIAHRLSTVVHADRIVVMAEGKIQEMGSHQQLYGNKKSLYRYFWSLQENDTIS